MCGILKKDSRFTGSVDNLAASKTPVLFYGLLLPMDYTPVSVRIASNLFSQLWTGKIPGIPTTHISKVKASFYLQINVIYTDTCEYGMLN